MCAPDKKSLLANKPLESPAAIIEAHNRMYDPEPQDFDDEQEDYEEFREEDYEDYQEEDYEEYRYEDAVQRYLNGDYDHGGHFESGAGEMAAFNRSPSPSSMTSEEWGFALLHSNGDFLNQETDLIEDIEDLEDGDDADDEGRAQVQPVVQQTFASMFLDDFDPWEAMLEENLESYRQQARAIAADQASDSEQASGSCSRSRSPSVSDPDEALMLLWNESWIAHRDGTIGDWISDGDPEPEPGFCERVKNVLVGAVQYVRQKLADLFGL